MSTSGHVGTGTQPASMRFASESNPRVDALFASLRGKSGPAKRAPPLRNLQNTLQVPNVADTKRGSARPRAEAQ